MMQGFAKPFPQDRLSLLRGFYGVIALLVAEIFLIVPIYRALLAFDCWQNWGAGICGPLFSAKASLYTILPVFVFVAMLLSNERKALTRDAAIRRRPLQLNLAGVAVFFLPLLWLGNGIGPHFVVETLAVWALGMGLAGAGAMLMLAPPARWRAILAQRGWLVAAILGAGLLAPFIARAAQPLWNIQILSDAAFHCVVWVMGVTGHPVTVDYPGRIIGTEDFSARIAPLCSGIEGIALIVFFVTLYLGLFRRELRFPAVLWLYPIGILASWGLNVVRISVLVLIGINGNPKLAQNGFHSHAGWLMFTVLALAIILLARSSGYFARTELAAPRRAAPFLRDPMVAQILPFAVFMASALLASTFAETPALVYPLRAAAMVAGLVPFLPFLARIEWRVDPLSVVAGLFIGVVWAEGTPVVTGSDQSLALALAGLGAPAFFGWVATRILGTVVLVPVIEELFFRGYLLQRIGGPGREGLRVLLGAVVTSALFGALHDRWALAFVAGLAFAGLRLRSGRIGDAILAHVVANAWIALMAVLANDWSLI